MSVIKRRLQELKEYPSAILGLTIIGILVIISLYAVITIPYGEAIRLWRGGEGVWIENPRNVPPAWTNHFPGVDRPETKVFSTLDRPDLKEITQVTDEVAEISISIPFTYEYDEFPREMSLFFAAEYENTRPFATIYWVTPDGREIELREGSIADRSAYRISQDRDLQRRKLDNLRPQVGLFAEEDSDPPRVLPGEYELRIEGYIFEPDSDLEAQFINYGQVHGLAGTDHRRRDISLALLWGTPIALAFGLLAAVGSTVTTMILAAIGVWYSRWVDGLIQKLTEVNLILQPLVVLVMIGTLYSRSIWVMLAVIIVLNIFSGAIKVYRSLFLQIKESHYVEAARAYGAGNLRIVFRYLIPRAIPVLVPQFVTLIPSLVFLEATLALLGLGDPVLPTWGKVLEDAQQHGALYLGHYYWVLSPSFLLILTGMGFSMVGFALDRILNPRLRGM